MLNGLRLLAPVSLLPELLRALDAAVVDAARALLEYAGRFEGEAEERGVVAATGRVFVGVFVPFVRRALVEGVYGAMMEQGGSMSEDLQTMVQQWEGWLSEVSNPVH